MSGKKFSSECEETERWYGTQFSSRKIDVQIIQCWEGLDLNDKLRLPLKNEYIPTDFDLVARDSCVEDHPTIVYQDDLGRV